MAAGRTVAQGSVADVLASTRPAAMWVKVGDLAAGAETLERAGLLRRARRGPPPRRGRRRPGRVRHPRARGRRPVPDRAASGRDQPGGRLLRPDRTSRGAQLMTRLVGAELQRIAARRLVRLTVVLAFVGIALGGLAAFVWSDSLSEADYQQRVDRGEGAGGGTGGPDRELPRGARRDSGRGDPGRRRQAVLPGQGPRDCRRSSIPPQPPPRRAPGCERSARGRRLGAGRLARRAPSSRHGA